MQSVLSDDKLNAADHAPYKVITLDIEHYQRMLDHPDLDDQHRDDILKALWSIICFFVDLGYQVEPEQSCGQDLGISALRGRQAGDLLELKRGPISDAFTKSASDIAAVNKEES